MKRWQGINIKSPIFIIHIFLFQSNTYQRERERDVRRAGATLSVNNLTWYDLALTLCKNTLNNSSGKMPVNIIFLCNLNCRHKDSFHYMIHWYTLKIIGLLADIARIQFYFWITWECMCVCMCIYIFINKAFYNRNRCTTK